MVVVSGCLVSTKKVVVSSLRLLLVSHLQPSGLQHWLRWRHFLSMTPPPPRSQRFHLGTDVGECAAIELQPLTTWKCQSWETFRSGDKWWRQVSHKRGILGDGWKTRWRQVGNKSGKSVTSSSTRQAGKVENKTSAKERGHKRTNSSINHYQPPLSSIKFI